MTWWERLQRDLRAEGARVAPRAEPPGLLITSYAGHPEAPRVELVLGASDLDAYLATLEPDAVDVFIEVSPAEAAYRLFLVHLDELIETTDRAEMRIRLVNGQLQAGTSA